jgi:hypothetical protein
VVSRATRVQAGVAGSKGVSLGDVLGMGEVELVLFMPQEVVRDKDGELVCGVGVRAQEQSKVKMGDMGPLSFGVEAGASALVSQFGGWWSGCSWILFKLNIWHCLYCFSRHGTWIWSAGS